MQVILDALSKRFGNIIAADSVSLQIEQGECFFLLGPSGCGKTTVLRLIAGFCVPDSGQVLFDGIPVNDRPAYQRNTGMVFQNYALWPHMTVFRNVEFGLTVPGRTVPANERKRRVMRILEIVHMEHLADRRPNQLSGGQQQRVALARALVVEPGCLLLDEPLSNLDAKLRITMRVEIKNIVKTIGITTIYVTHDQEEALSMADRCAVLQNGRVEQLGTPRDLYERPANHFVADFIGGANLFRGIIRSVTDRETRIETPFGEWVSASTRNTFRTGDSVVLSVRPESLHFMAQPGNMSNSFTGKVAETMYYGDLVEYWITMSDGIKMKVVQTGPFHAAQLTQTDVNFQADPSDVVILPV